MPSEKQIYLPQFPPIVKIGGIHYVSREGLDRFKRATAGVRAEEAKPSERNQFVRIAQAAAELGVNPRTLLRMAGSQSASA